MQGDTREVREGEHLDWTALAAYLRWPTAVDDQTDVFPTVTGRPGYLTRDELIDRYARQSGCDVDAIAYFEAFAVFRLAVRLQQVYAGHANGNTPDPQFARLGARVRALAGRALSLTRSS